MLLKQILYQSFRYKTYCQFSNHNFSHYVTTPIFYVNSSPHVGHVYTVVLADAINRYQRLIYKDEQSLFSAGTDEHGLKIQLAAQLANQDVQHFCDINSNKFSNLFKSHNLTITDFIRTSDSKHKIAVQSLWKQLVDRDLIYKSSYSGWYCTSDETFVPETQIEKTQCPDGSIAHFNQDGKPVHWSSEENYIFKFSIFRDRLLDWLEKERPVRPARFNDEAIGMLKKVEVGDLSVSRPKGRVSWGIEVPHDDDHTIYVWLDALTNYLTVSGYPCSNQRELKHWPIDCQVFGKDILKFHAIIWPSILLALELPLPKKLICHSHWLVGTQKMSKSLGNSIDPILEANHLTTEGLRYYLLRAGTPHSDTNYNRDQAVQRINSELANTYGNLLSRACSSKINPAQSIPTNLSDRPDIADIIELKQRLYDGPEICSLHYDEGDFYKGIDEVLSILRLANQIYEKAQPWNLVKQMGTDYYDVQAITFESLRVCSILLQPVVPNLANVILDILGVNDRSWANSSLRLNSQLESTMSLKLDTHQLPVFPKLLV